jgi:DNA polymerase-3 subunit alpha
MRKVNKRVMESLIKCGAFDSMGAKRAQLMTSIDRIMDVSQSMQRETANGQISIFNTISGGNNASAAIELPCIEEWQEAELLTYEKEALGFYITGHPLTKYVKELTYLANTDTEKIKERQDEENVSIGGIITVSKEVNTKKGDRMAFITLEDMNGSVEVVVFSDVYKSAAPYFSGDTPILVKGKVDKGEENVKVIASAVYPLEQAKELIVNIVHITTDVVNIKSDSLEEMKRILNDHHGISPVYIHLVLPDREVVIAAPDELRVDPSEGFVRDIETLLGGGSCNISHGGVN